MKIFPKRSSDVSNTSMSQKYNSSVMSIKKKKFPPLLIDSQTYEDKDEMTPTVKIASSFKLQSNQGQNQKKSSLFGRQKAK